MRDVLLANGGWLLRVLTVTALVAVIALSLFPRIVSHISTSAVINAPILVIRSPVDGVIEDYALEHGARVSRGQQIAVLREAGTDRTQRVDLESRLAMARAAVVAVETRIEDVERLLRQIETRHHTYHRWHLAILARDVEAIAAQLRGAKARQAALERDAERQAELHRRKMIPDSQKQDAAARLAEQSERVQELEARLAAQELRLNAMQDGILAGTEGTNTSYTLQRQDEIRLELARLRDELADHRAERAALETQLAQVREIFLSENRVTLASPIDGVVWRSASLVGRPVLPGDDVVEILDCRARYLEAYLPEGLMGRIATGDPAEVRLTGDNRSFTAPIVSVLGHGARFDHVELAAQDTAPKAGKMRVLIALSDDVLARDPGAFCHVGRTAQVSLPRDLSAVSQLAERVSHGMRSAVTWFETATSPLLRG